jgi:hypothetical protein
MSTGVRSALLVAQLLKADLAITASEETQERAKNIGQHNIAQCERLARAQAGVEQCKSALASFLAAEDALKNNDIAVAFGEVQHELEHNPQLKRDFVRMAKELAGLDESEPSKKTKPNSDPFPTCPVYSHAVTINSLSSNGYTCNVCKQDFSKRPSDFHYQCRLCDWDACVKCRPVPEFYQALNAGSDVREALKFPAGYHAQNPPPSLPASFPNYPPGMK